MKKIIILIVFLSAAFVLLQSCKESSLYPNLTDKEDSRNLLDSGYYPNTVGSYWRYVIWSSDTIPYIMDTVEVRLANKELKLDSSQFLTYYYFYYQFSYNYSSFEVLNKDTVERLNNPNVPFKSYLIIPFTVGKTNVASIVDSIYNSEQVTVTMLVESYDSVTVKAGTFMAYKIVTTIEYGRFGSSPFYTREILRFVPYVGFITIEDEYWDENNRQYFSKEKWELMDYKIEKK